MDIHPTREEFVALAQTGATDASTAPSLAALSAELLLVGAPYVAAVPNK